MARTATSRLLAVHATWVCLLVVCIFAFPHRLPVVWFLIMVTTLVSIAAGLRVYRPDHRLPWLLLAGSIVAFLVGNMVNFAITDDDRPRQLPGYLDLVYLVAYLLAVAGLLCFIRRGSAGRDRASLLDALIATGAIAFVCWVYLIHPYIRDPTLSWAYRMVAMAYPIADLVVLTLVVRLLVLSSAANRAVWLLAAGTIGLLGSDTLEALSRLGEVRWPGRWGAASVGDLGWVLFAVCWGAAALVPSMERLSHPAPLPHAGARPARIALLALAALVTPAVIIIELLRSGHATRWFGPALSAAVFTAVLARLSLVLADHRRALSREQALRTTSAALVASAKTEEIGAIVTATAAALFGPRGRHRVLVAVADSGRIHVASGGDAGGEDVEEAQWREAVGFFAGPGRTGSRPIAVGELPPVLGAKLSGLDYALVYPLNPVGRPDQSELAELSEQAALPQPHGLLVAAGDEAGLASLAGSLEILANQASLALQRVALGRSIARHQGESHFRALIQNTHDAVLIVDADGLIRYASPSAEPMLGTATAAGRTLAELVGPGPAARLPALLALWRDQARQSGQTRDEPEDWRVARPDGSTLDLEVRCADLRDEPTVGGIVVTLRDVTRARHLEATLRRRAYTDPQTGLPNRLAFIEHADAALAARPPESTYAVLIDIDDFRQINDTRGRTEADELLQAAAERLGQLLRPGDMMLARTGADEFAVLVATDGSPAAAKAQAEGLAEQIAGTFAAPFRLSSGPIAVSVSGGVAQGRPGSDAAGLLADADVALHAAMADGRRLWRWFEPSLRDSLAEHAAHRASLDRALAENSFAVHYQPCVCLASGVVVGFEALARWPQAVGGPVPPDRFIPLAEATGQILPLGDYILTRAAHDAGRWNRRRAGERGRPLKISVNASPYQLSDDAFPAQVGAALAGAGLDPAHLVVEATESGLISRGGYSAANLCRVKDLGVRLALDDFGTGYSSLSYLRDLPFDILKIDKRFVDDIVGSDAPHSLTAGIVGIGLALGLGVVAEGIETPEQWASLRRMGCHEGQGYYFGRPMPVEQIEDFLLADPTGDRPEAWYEHEAASVG